MAATDCSDDTSQLTQRLATGSFHQLHGRGAVGDVDHRNVHAVLGQSFREGLPDAVRRAGDDGDFVFVTLGHFDSPCFFLSSPGRAQRESR
jgi:hypothetical protein